jgi:transposase
MNRDDLEKLSKRELVALVLKLQRPSKTSRTSSKPPSSDKKARQEHARPGGAKSGHEGHCRSLHESPDETVDHRPDVCPRCHSRLDDDLAGTVIGEYDEIEVPPIKPFVRRHRRLSVCCPQCLGQVKGPLPDVACGSPFGPRLHALVLYLKTFQAVSFVRLERMLADLFGVTLSQGALAKMLRRSHVPFAAQKAEIIKDLRRADVVASDETGIRIEGLNGYHWVFMSRQAIVHEAQLSRGAKVVRDVLLSDAVHRLPGEGWERAAPSCGCRMGIPRNRAMANAIRPAWPIWPATWPMRCRRAATWCRFGSSCGWIKCSNWRRA